MKILNTISIVLLSILATGCGAIAEVAYDVAIDKDREQCNRLISMSDRQSCMQKVSTTERQAKEQRSMSERVENKKK